MSKKVNCSVCGKEVDIRGIRMHELMCQSKGGGGYSGDTPKKKTKGLCDECGSDNVRFLSKGDNLEGYLISRGFIKICDDCEEVF